MSTRIDGDANNAKRRWIIMMKYIRLAFVVIYFLVVTSICISIFHESLRTLTTHSVRGYNLIYTRTACMTISIFAIVGAIRVLLLLHKKKQLWVNIILNASSSIGIALCMFLPVIFILGMLSNPVLNTGRSLGIVGYYGVNAVVAMIGAYFAPLLLLRQWKTGKNQSDV